MAETILLAIGLVLIVEGLVYALAPGVIEDLLDAIRRLSIENRRQLGLIVIAFGAIFVWVSTLVG